MAIDLTTYVALLRAVNVGGAGKLPMSDLKALCVGAGFAKVRTYVASGNVVFASRATPARVKADLEAALEAHAGKPVGVLVRTTTEMADVLAANPFPAALANRVAAIFLDAPPPANAGAVATGRNDEVIAPGTREIYVHYPSGMGTSKLKIPAAKAGTARNMNTVAALCRMATDLYAGGEDLRSSLNQSHGPDDRRPTAQLA